jgi:hypothetical protein
MATSMTAEDEPVSVWMLANGSASGGVATLDPSLLSLFGSSIPFRKVADLTKFFVINQTGIVTWVVDGYPYTEPTTPILFGDGSDGWQANSTVHMPFNSTIDVIMTIANDSMDMVGSFLQLSSLLVILANLITLHRWAIQCIFTGTSFGSWDPVMDHSCTGPLQRHRSI